MRKRIEKKKEQPLMVKKECKEVSISSKRLAKKDTHFTIKTNIKEAPDHNRMLVPLLATVMRSMIDYRSH